MKRIKKWFDNLSKPTKEKIFFIFNYFINAIPLSILFFIVMGLWLVFSVPRYILTYICMVIFLIYFEHYYVWLKENR